MTDHIQKARAHLVARKGLGVSGLDVGILGALECILEHLERQRQAPPRLPQLHGLNLAELQKLCDGATPGPWKVVGGSYLKTADGDQLADVKWYADADFIAAARYALPKLIAKVRELEVDAAYWHKEYVKANTGEPCPALEESFKELTGRA